MFTVRQRVEGEERTVICATAVEAINLAEIWERQGPRVVITSPAGFGGYIETLRELALSGSVS